MKPVVNSDLNADLTVAQAARILGIHRDSVSELIKAGLIESYFANPLANRRSRRITREALAAFKSSNRVPVKA